MLRALDPVVGAGPILRAVEHRGQRPIEDVVDQGGLAGARHPGDRGEGAERDLHAHPLQVVLAGVVDDHELAVGLPADGGHRDALHPGQEPSGERVGVRHHLVGRAHRDHVPAQLARAGPEIDHVVGGPHGLLVVLHHQHRVAEVAQALERVEEPAVVPLVQADGGLVQDVEDTDQARADLGGEADALAFPARERRRGPVQGQVVEPDLGEEAEALADLLEYPARDGHLALGQGQRVEELARRLDGEPHHVGDGPPRDLDRERLRPQPGAATGRAVPLGHEVLDFAAGVLGHRLLVAAIEQLHHALEAVVRLAVQDDVPGLLRQLGPRGVEAEPVALREHPQRLLEDRRRGRPRPRQERAAGQGLGGIRHHPLGIDLVAGADAAAVRAGAVRVVEREHARRHLREGDAAGGAGQPLREEEGGAVGDLHLHHPVGQPQRGLERVGQAATQVVLHHQPVHHHLDGVLLGLGQLDVLGQLTKLPVDPDPHVALPAQVVEELAVLALAAAHDGREHHDAAAHRQGHHPVHHLLDGLGRDHVAALGTVRDPDPREEHPQVVVDLGDGADRRARVLGGRLLLDRDGGGEPLDRVHVRLLHLLEELAGVGGERLDIAALAFSIDGVEGERGLARSGQPGDHHELVAGELEIDGLEIVLAGSADDDPVVGHGRSIIPPASSGVKPRAAPPARTA